MINWQDINNKIFEDIAYEYMSANYPDLVWTKTKLTNDGNKDGESTISNLPINVTIKYWYEAKYTVNTNKSIPKSHLDSTLVSSLLDGQVFVIAFITNAYISDDYKRRADIFAKHRDNLQIYYINGEEIENWLSDNPEIEERYFKTHSAQKIDITDKIEEACFLDKYNNDTGSFVNLSTLEVNKDYFIYIRYKSSKNQQLNLSIDNAIAILQKYSNSIVKPNILSATKGNNAFFVPIKIISPQKEYALTIKGDTEVQNYTIQGIRTLDLYTPKLVISSQINLLNDFHLFIKSNDINNLIFWAIGDAGSGKTHTLNLLRNDLGNPFSSILLSFTGKAECDFIICYKLFIYCQYGSMWELSINNIDEMNFHPIVKDVLTEIHIGISSSLTQERLTEYCSNGSNNFTEQYFIQQQIYIDDIHKISQEVVFLFCSILEWCGSQRLNKRFFLFSRDISSEYPYLYEFLNTTACCIKKIENPTYADVKASLEANWEHIPNLISLIQSYQYTFNALTLYNFLCTLNEKLNDIRKLDIVDASVEMTKIFNNISYTEKSKIESRLIKEYKSNIIFNFVYKLEDGIPTNAFIDFFGDSAYAHISELHQKRIIKERAGKLYPFHDILLERFQNIKSNTYVEKLGEFILFCIEKSHISQSEGYYYLVALGGQYFWKYRLIAEEFRDQMHENANYFAAEKIARKIKTENQKELCDYDYNDIKNLFILGNCSKYTTSYELSNKIFEEIKSIYQNSTLNLPDDILLETYSETINNNLWMLNIKKADSDLKKMHQMFNHTETTTNKSKTYKYGYLNYYNRRMFCDFMLGESSEESYITALSKAKEIGLKQYEGFAHMDYAKSIYNINISRAISLLNEAKNIFESENEPRRLLDALSELEFIDVLQRKTYETSKLEEIYNIMKDRKYIQSYTRTYLKIMVVNLLSENYALSELLDMMNIILAQNKSFASGKRHQALTYHVLAAAYYKDGNLKESKKYSLKCLGLFNELGDTYKLIHRHNSEINAEGNIILGCENNPNILGNNFILDMRIW